MLRTRVSAFLVLISVATPLAAFARPLSDVVHTAQKTVTRGEFLSWAEEALHTEKPDECDLQYKRYPKSMKPTLCAAQDKNALDGWQGSDAFVVLRPSITRGEAIAVLTALTGNRSATDVSAFTDVKTVQEKQSVGVAIDQKWMHPMRATFFGVATPLTGTEALSLLQAASGTSSTPTFTIQLNGQSAQSPTTFPKQDVLQAVWELLQKQYLRRDKVNNEDAAYKAIEGLVGSLNDPYTTFFRPATASNFETQIKGELSGIGAHIEDRGGIITVVSPITGSPAEKAGLKPDDQIIEVNGTPVTNLGVDKAVGLIRGEKGTIVTLKIRRNNIDLIVQIQRDIVTIPEVSVSWSGDIAIIQLMQFGDTTDKRIREIMADIVKQKPRGLLLDLRNNPGGLLHAADTVVSDFVPKGSVVAQVKSPDDSSNEVTSDDPILDPSVKMAVLVNKGSASASEIVAGALQDMKRATIVGTQTFGKGTVQAVYGFKTGEALKITIAEWLTPLGRKIDGIGVKPDIVVETDDRDLQMKRALDLLR